MANDDAHLKNWSLVYADTITPELVPAYDIVTARVYREDERKFVLNLGKNEEWYTASLGHFQIWAGKPHLFDTLD